MSQRPSRLDPRPQGPRKRRARRIPTATKSAKGSKQPGIGPGVRDRARVVDIGKTKLDLAWNDWYEKELDIRFSRSYGPGRYDPTYEEQGVDYPIGYVRWTERRELTEREIRRVERQMSEPAKPPAPRDPGVPFL